MFVFFLINFFEIEKTDPTSWTSEQVGQFVLSINADLECVFDRIISNGVDGDLMQDFLTDKEMLTTLGCEDEQQQAVIKAHVS